MSKSSGVTPIAGHHPECREYDYCTCRELYRRDQKLEEQRDLVEAYSQIYDPDWNS